MARKVKAGHKTTEFAITVLFIVLMGLSMATGFIKDPTFAAVASGIVAAAYAIARGLAKQHGVDVPDALEEPPKK